MPPAPGPPENSGPCGRVSEKCWCAPDPTLPAKGAGDRLMRSPWRRAARPMMIRVSTNWSAAATGGSGDKRDLELVGPVLGVELLDPHAGGTGRCDHIADERLVLEHAGEAVLRPQCRRQPATARIDEDELDFMADRRLEAGFTE